MGNDVARDIHCDVTMNNDVPMCTCGITMHNDVLMNLLYYIFSALCLIMILLCVVLNKNTNKFMFDQSCWRTHELFLCGVISLVLWTQLMCSPQTEQTLTYSCYYNKTTRVWCAVCAQVILRHRKQSDLATQHTRQRLFCVYAILFI